MEDKYKNFFEHCNRLVDDFNSKIAEKEIKDILDSIENKAALGEREYISKPISTSAAVMIGQHEVFKNFRVYLYRGYRKIDDISCANWYTIETRPNLPIKKIEPFVDLKFNW